MKNFGSNNVGKIVLIILAVVIALAAIVGVVLGIINTLNNKPADVPEDTNTVIEKPADSEYPSLWYGDESYRYRLLSDTEMEISVKRVVTGSIRPTVKYFSFDDGELKANYIDANDTIQYKVVYSYSVRCEYTTDIVNGRTVYNVKDVYFPSIEETPNINIMYTMNGVYADAPEQNDISNYINHSAATASMRDHVTVDTANFQKYHMLQQEISVILYDSNYIAADEIVLNN